ncbi:hypothetical protein QFC22_003862 [Naganishia vaughanmartiniae]|uniref:Uncharacterized protein n=1 Tax=Naganishia vaughanmartiniae TaxID=1424756 RepID=A0ACC2X438_9TREE|nr:hypothetical protein QFC22_003862 [Naganishia vaughanmartiniae]
MSSQIKDQATLSNYHQVRNLHTHLQWTIDWNDQLIAGTATLTMKPETDEPVTRVVLDTSYLDIRGVKVDGEKVEFKLEIEYSTTKECTALGWLTKEVMATGRPREESSRTSILRHRRSTLDPFYRVKVLFPLSNLPTHPYTTNTYTSLITQPPPPPLAGPDTPSIKSAYSATVKSTIPVLLSALRKSPPVELPHGGKEIGRDVVEYVYEQPVPIPSYLIAIAAGNVVYKQFPQVAGRSWTAGVWTEPEGIEDAYWEFSEDIGRKLLRDALKEMPPKYQKLVIDYEQHADPDDGFSTVPYDNLLMTIRAGNRGSNFLLHIERQVGGLDVFRPYIKSYIKKFSGNVVTTEEWRAHLYDFFGKHDNGKQYIKKLDEIKWDEWLHGSGDDLPVDMKYDETLALQCYELANRWKAASEKDDYSEFSSKDMQELTATQRSKSRRGHSGDDVKTKTSSLPLPVVFLERMQSMPKFPVSTLKALDKIYKLDSSTNGEVRLRWYGLVLPVGAEYAQSAAG